MQIKRSMFVGIAALAIGGSVGVPAFASGAAVVNSCPSNAGTCSFNYLPAGATTNAGATFSPVNYHDVLTPSGVENESFSGQDQSLNTTGQTWSWTSATASSVDPSRAKCGSFVTGHATTDFLMTIQPDGSWTLDCHFAKS